jgi:hypothetical protein
VKESDQLIWLIAWLGISKTPIPGKGEVKECKYINSFWASLLTIYLEPLSSSRNSPLWVGGGTIASTLSKLPPWTCFPCLFTQGWKISFHLLATFQYNQHQSTLDDQWWICVSKQEFVREHSAKLILRVAGSWLLSDLWDAIERTLLSNSLLPLT